MAIMKNFIKKNLVFIIVASIYSLLLFIYYLSISSVEYAMNKIAYSYVISDTSMFNTYVDTRSLVRNYLKTKPDDETNIFELIHEDELYDNVEDSYVDEVETWVEFGYKENPITKALLRNKDLQDSIKNNSSKLIRLDKPIIKGDSALVRLYLYQPRYDTLLTLDFRLVDVGHNWRLVEISNLQKSLILINELEHKKNNSIRNKASKELLNHIKLSKLVLTDGKYLSLNMENISNKEIDSISFTVHFYDKNDLEIKNYKSLGSYISDVCDMEDSQIISMYISESNLKPHQPFQNYTITTYNRDVNKLSFYLEDVFIKFKDGSKIDASKYYHPTYIYAFKHFLINY